VTLTRAGYGSARLAILEAANTGNLDQFSCKAGSGSAADSGSILTTAGNELIVGVASSNDSSTATAGTGFTLLDSAGKVFSEYQLQPLAGTVDARMSLSPRRRDGLTPWLPSSLRHRHFKCILLDLQRLPSLLPTPHKFQNAPPPMVLAALLFKFVTTQRRKIA